MQSIVELIKADTEERKKREEEQDQDESAKEAKVREKMSMEDAARYIQRRWVWFQTEGKFLAKKGKKGRKGKKKKKKWQCQSVWLTAQIQQAESFICSNFKNCLQSIKKNAKNN